MSTTMIDFRNEIFLNLDAAYLDSANVYFGAFSSSGIDVAVLPIVMEACCCRKVMAMSLATLL